MDKGKSPTAGLRGAHWDASRVPENMRTAPHVIATEDGASTMGLLMQLGGEKTVVCLMHPREFVATHYLIPELIRNGCAVWVQAPRSIGNDLRLEHEIALYDVAAGVVFLRECGFENVILLGNSGGASLYALYCEQALATPSARLERTPGGRPTKLEKADLPLVDGVVFVSPHPGQGILLMNALDPSVIDEDDPFATEPSLFAFSPKNGFAQPPGSSSFTPEFIARYRAAQRDRVARIDEFAKARIAGKRAASGRAKENPNPADRMRASFGDIFTIWRTDADLRCWDLSLDPSDRKVGSLWGANPVASNFGSVGFGRVCTPESWLSTWSGLSSNARLDRCAPHLTLPFFLLEYSGDNSVFPSDTNALFDAIGSSDKARIKLKGDHHGRAIQNDEASAQIEAGKSICDWIAARFDVLVS